MRSLSAALQNRPWTGYGRLYLAKPLFLFDRELQRGVPGPYGEAFSKETLVRSASSKAQAATTHARIGR